MVAAAYRARAAWSILVFLCAFLAALCPLASKMLTGGGGPADRSFGFFILRGSLFRSTPELPATVI